MQPPKTIVPIDLKTLIENETEFTLLDVREHQEVAINQIAGATHIPMNEIPQRFAELDTKKQVVVYCHHGMRSYQVGAYLLQQGFEDVSNLDGGINQYAAAVDRDLGFY